MDARFKITEEESGMLELEANAGRLGSIASELQKMKFADENDHFRTVLREAIIAYLWNFL